MVPGSQDRYWLPGWLVPPQLHAKTHARVEKGCVGNFGNSVSIAVSVSDRVFRIVSCIVSSGAESHQNYTICDGWMDELEWIGWVDDRYITHLDL